MTITFKGINSMFSKDYSGYNLKSQVTPQFPVMNKDLIGNLIDSEKASKSKTSESRKRQAFEQLLPPSFDIFVDRDQLYLFPVLFVLSSVLSFDIDLRLKLNQSYSGQIPAYTFYLLQSVRTGLLDRSGDAISSLCINSTYFDWLDDYGLKSTILDPRWLKEGDNFSELVNFFSRLVHGSDPYVSSVNFKPVDIHSGSTITLSGLSSYNGKIWSHTGTSAYDSVPAENALIALLCGVQLVKSDSTLYQFSDSSHRLVPNISSGTYPVCISTLFAASETTVSDSTSSSFDSSSILDSNTRHPVLKAGFNTGINMGSNKRKRGPKPSGVGKLQAYNVVGYSPEVLKFIRELLHLVPETSS